MRSIQRPSLGTYFLLASGLWLVAVTIPAFAEDQASAPLRGRWQAVELVDDGRVIPEEAIPTWMPTGGQIEVIDNAFVFTSPSDGQRHARTFEVDATRYPCEINFREEGRSFAHGIYQIDQGRWVICASPISTARPTDFSASKGSQRVLIVLKRPADSVRTGGAQPTTTTVQIPPPPADVKVVPTVTAVTKGSLPGALDLSKLPPPPDLRNVPGTTGKILTDAEVLKMILGTWKYKDAYGDFYLALDSKGTFNTYRETAKTSTFQQVFVRAPISSGVWTLKNGQLTLRCTTSVHLDRVNQMAPYAVRSVSDNDVIFTDTRGLAIKGVKVR